MNSTNVPELDEPAPAERRVRRTTHGVRLSKKDAQQIIEAHGLPPILSLDEASDYARLSKGTVQNQVTQGRYARSALTGRPLQFITLLFIQDHAARGGGRA
ncbi:hypothetical protein OT109_09375 [Phycisphaeraceae bacterium D3-23]